MSGFDNLQHRSYLTCSPKLPENGTPSRSGPNEWEAAVLGRRKPTQTMRSAFSRHALQDFG
jgi:hypothetical protein